MNIYKYKHVKENVRIEIETETEGDAYRILMHTVIDADKFYLSFE